MKYTHLFEHESISDLKKKSQYVNLEWCDLKKVTNMDTVIYELLLMVNRGKCVSVNISHS